MDAHRQQLDEWIKEKEVLLVTGGYDHTIKVWQAHSGVCKQTMQHADSVSFQFNFRNFSGMIKFIACAYLEQGKSHESPCAKIWFC